MVGQGAMMGESQGQETSEAQAEATAWVRGLAEYEVRRWRRWHRHVTLAVLAHADRSATRAHAGRKGTA